MTNCQNENCCMCPNFVSTTAITQVGNALVLAIPSSTQLTNNKKLCIAFAQNVPNLTGIPYVAVEVNGTRYPVIQTQSCPAHLLYSDQLKQCNCGIANRQLLSVKYSADLGMFNYAGCRRLPKTNAIVETGNSLAVLGSNAFESKPKTKPE